MIRTNKKLMVSLCGLALSSLFVLNNKSVVHADSVTCAQNNAISWDSDQDDSQIVQESQIKTEQAMPQKADDSQRNAVQPVRNSAENSSAINDQNSRANLVSKVDDAQADKPVTITNPANNRVHVHYVDQNGNDIKDAKGNIVDIGDYNIDVSKSSQGSYKVPAGYNLNNEDAKYNVQVNDVVQTIVKPKYDMGYADSDMLDDPDLEDTVVNISPVDVRDYSIGPKYRYKVLYDQDGFGTVFLYRFKNQDQAVDDLASMMKQATNGAFDLNNPAYANKRVAVKTAFNSDRIVLQYGVSDPSTDVYDQDYSSSVSLPNNEFRKWLTKYNEDDQNFDNYGDYHDGEHGDAQREYLAFLMMSNGSKTENKVIGQNHVFSDNSGNAKSVSGNTVNVPVIKPQSVNPAMDTRCQSQATRTIQINFPDGQIPEAYDGIVDKSGKLAQTVHFTRTATEDALTGNILQYGKWTSDNQDPNFLGFSERTLPRIPGYTLSIKPA